MNDIELLNKILEDEDFEKNAAQIISEQIDKELEKKSPDYNRIAELSRQYSEVVDVDDDVINSSREHCQKIVSFAQNHRPKYFFSNFFLAIAASMAIVIFSANCYTVAALNMNIFKALVHYANKGFSVDFTSLQEKSDDPYGIKAECAKHNIFTEVPTYLPDEIDYLSSEYEESGIENSILFYYGNFHLKLSVCKHPPQSLNVIPLKFSFNFFV